MGLQMWNQMTYVYYFSKKTQLELRIVFIVVSREIVKFYVNCSSILGGIIHFMHNCQRELFYSFSEAIRVIIHLNSCYRCRYCWLATEKLPLFRTVCFQTIWNWEEMSLFSPRLHIVKYSILISPWAYKRVGYVTWKIILFILCYSCY